MAQQLPELQLAAALAEEIYRRANTKGAGDLPIDIDRDLGLKDSPDLPQDGLEIDEQSRGTGTYYYNPNGFVGRVVEANGKTFVVFRGTDAAGSLGGGRYDRDPIHHGTVGAIQAHATFNKNTIISMT